MWRQWRGIGPGVELGFSGRGFQPTQRYGKTQAGIGAGFCEMAGYAVANPPELIE